MSERQTLFPAEIKKPHWIKWSERSSSWWCLRCCSRKLLPFSSEEREKHVAAFFEDHSQCNVGGNPPVCREPQTVLHERANAQFPVDPFDGFDFELPPTPPTEVDPFS